ncbi:MAG: UDP-glucose 4-epimerase GalE [Reyranella sp.]|uniref:UDP-glucose 4-epimerase GalE n=1 Tax=Reyranella sp. TaxID=1929291 RepID=UPI003D150343
MRVLVAGGAGYIGSHTCKALAQAGHLPIVYDNLHTGHDWAVKWGPLERGDLNDRTALSVAMHRHRPEAVIDFAALAYVGDSMKEPTEYYRVNVGGTIALLEAMRANDVGSIVFSSTCATYGVPKRMPIVETMEQEPINAYGRSKRMAEEILRDACAAHGVGAIALRYFNAAGADPDGQLGEEHDPEPHLIPLVLQTALGHRPSIAIFGTDYDTPDGTCVRDYVHVSDLAAAHVAAVAACRPGHFAAYNLGTGRGASINEVIAQARAITRRPIPAEAAARRPGDPPFLVADASLAKQFLSWSSPRSGLDAVIETAWRWMTTHRTQAMAAPGPR